MLESHPSVASYEVEMCHEATGVLTTAVPNIDIIHIDPIDDPMNRRITAVIMNGLLTEL